MTPSAAARVLAIVELLEKILSNLDLPEELFRFQRVSRTFYDTIKGSKTLRRKMRLEQYDSLEQDEQLLHPFLGSGSTCEKRLEPGQPAFCVSPGYRPTAMLNTHSFALTAQNDRGIPLPFSKPNITKVTRRWWSVEQLKASTSSAKLIFRIETEPLSAGGRMHMGRYSGQRLYNSGSWRDVLIARAKVSVDVIVKLDNGKRTLMSSE